MWTCQGKFQFDVNVIQCVSEKFKTHLFLFPPPPTTLAIILSTLQWFCSISVIEYLFSLYFYGICIFFFFPSALRKNILSQLRPLFQTFFWHYWRRHFWHYWKKVYILLHQYFLNFRLFFHGCLYLTIKFVAWVYIHQFLYSL